MNSVTQRLSPSQPPTEEQKEECEDIISTRSPQRKMCLLLGLGRFFVHLLTLVDRGSDILGIAPVKLPHKEGGNDTDSDGNHCEEESDA
jgi:hypothetical protein